MIESSCPLGVNLLYASSTDIFYYSMSRARTFLLLLDSRLLATNSEVSSDNQNPWRMCHLTLYCFFTGFLMKRTSLLDQSLFGRALTVLDTEVSDLVSHRNLRFLSTGFEPVTLGIPVNRFTDWAGEAGVNSRFYRLM